MSSPGSSRGHTPAEPLSGPLARGAVLGRYVVLGRIGAGGMGVVHEAYDPDLDRKVALKVVQPGVAGGLGLIAEARAMARLAHPNVIAVYDVGTAGGQVFIAMEHVPGATLRELTAEPRPWREVLALFAQAGRGLAAAHAAGLVHRDFKPQNVLVSDDGRARVLDFGLAHAAGEEGARGGTPAYAAPELLAPGDAVGPAADQYSFAVALHEALWGTRPSAGQPPPRERRPGWLAAVVDRALAAAPGDRFPSMDALLDALGRDPAARRRRVAVGLLVAGAALLGVAGVSGALEDRPRPCQGSSEALAPVWNPARRARIAAAFRASGSPRAGPSLARAAELLDHYAAGWVAARGAACEATRVHGEQPEELLGLRMVCFDERRADLDGLAGVLEQADAAVVGRSIEAALALPPLSRCDDVKALQSRLPPPADPETARRVTAVRALLAQVRALKNMGKYRAALALAEAAGASAQALRYCPLDAEVKLLLGDIHEPLGEVKESERALWDALVTAEGCRYDEATERVLSLLAYHHGIVMSQPAEGERWSRHAEAVIARMGGNDQLEATRLSNLAVMLDGAGRYDEALVAGRRAIELTERSLGATHVSMASAYANHGITLKNVGRLVEAQATLEKALAVATHELGPDHPTVARVLNILGSTLRWQGKLDETAAVQRRALAILEAATPGGLDVGVSANNLANTLVSRAEYAEAKTLYGRARELFAANVGKEHPYVGKTLAGTGLCLYHEGRYAEARAALGGALALAEKNRGREHIDVVGPLSNLALVAVAEGRLPEAERDARRAVAVVEKAIGPEAPALVDPLNALGLVLEAEGKLAAALEVHRRGVTVGSKEGGAVVSESLAGVGRISMRLGRTREAVAALERALALEEERRSPEDLATVKLLLAQALWRAHGDAARARALAGEARDGFRALGLEEDAAGAAAWLARPGGSRVLP